MLSVNSWLHLTPRPPSEPELHTLTATTVEMRMKPGRGNEQSDFIEQQYAGGCYQ